MFTTRIIEAIDIFEDGHFCLPARVPDASPDQFCLNSFEECFHSRIVVTITFS
tara:strand:+ start:628 stop:786 length:159 start_codon:yes stop_codon:yes gene_type:complete